MYTKKIGFKDLYDKPRNATLHFNLYEREVFKLMVEFQAIFDWQEKLKEQESGASLPTEEVLHYYNQLEEILLSSYGVPEDDGLTFEKSGRYKFEQSPMFAAIMNEFVSDPTESTKLIDGLMPKGLQDLVKKADANLALALKNDNNSPEMQAQIERLQAQLREATGGANSPVTGEVLS